MFLAFYHVTKTSVHEYADANNIRNWKGVGTTKLKWPFAQPNDPPNAAPNNIQNTTRVY